MKFSERDERVAQLNEQLREIEQRLIPTGLHVFGRSAELKEKRDLLRMVGSFDRPEHDVRALPRLVAEGLRIGDYGELIKQPSETETTQLIDGIVTEAVTRFCDQGVDAAVNYLKERANVDGEQAT